ncbi:uncharacterized protein DUF262 [Stackebrandtia albiflava]|uniref:Uncharacterized protein DUF262 n=1 Tax=Stackebrandtia albiflava TaxID=406432 RepID=A0A562V3A8_9ACTN|nr:DUF262 domain-containing protein [Stackebrandtia albiflava]TWJ12345.1 uncharacterized protein DUF262 [Stackebrandtia albiflava]
MAAMHTQPSAETFPLEDLVRKAWGGRIRVPHFQRDFRWTTNDVLQLFDSIVKGYPIGTLLFWVRKSPAAKVVLGKLVIDAAAGDQTWWVVDGQQRIVSLANALKREGHAHKPFDVFYDLAEERFVSTPRRIEERHIPLPILFDLEELLAWFATRGHLPGEYFPRARAVARRILEYRIPTYLVPHDDRAALRDIFDRMNNFGKRLSRAEIFSALYAGEEPPVRRNPPLTQIAQRLEQSTDFGRIDDDTILMCLLARRGPDVTRDFRGEFDEGRRVRTDFPDEDQQGAYDGAEAAVRAAVNFLQSDCHTPHFSFLPYHSLLAVLSRFFAHHPRPVERNRQLLRRFFWRASLAGPATFGGSFTQFARKLAQAIIPGGEARSVSQLLAAVPGSQIRPNLDERFKANSANGKVLLCSWWALEPRSPFSGATYSTRDLSDTLADDGTARAAIQDIIRPKDMPAELRGDVAGRVLLPGVEEPVDEAGIVFGMPPYMEVGAWDAVLASHSMTRETAAYLQWGNRVEFLTTRRHTIVANLEKFCDRMAEWERENTPPLESLVFDET